MPVDQMDVNRLFVMESLEGKFIYCSQFLGRPVIIVKRGHNDNVVCLLLKGSF